MTGEVFWKRVPNAVRFLTDAVDELLCGKSVVMSFPSEVPWGDVMEDVLAENLAPYLDTRSFDRFRVQDVDRPGDFLLQRYFSERERQNYWPAHGSVETFMAKNPNSPMHRRIICASEIRREHAMAWAASVSDYRSHISDPDDAALFVLIASNADIPDSDIVAVLDYADYISDYDRLMLCMNLLAELNCSSLEKQYISELAVRMGGSCMEYAGQLAEHGKDLLCSPYTIFRSVFHNLPVDEAKELADQALWEAQIRIVYPELEHFRRDFIRKYQKKLANYLPIRDSSGENTTDVRDLELGQIYYICRNNHIAEKRDYDALCNMRDARNLIAHGNTIPYHDLKTLGIL